MARRPYSETVPLDPPQVTRLALHFIDEPGRAPVPIDRQLQIGRDEECEAGSCANVAFFPAPAGLPLYHSYPQ